MRLEARSTKLMLCLAAVYLIWGSSFLFTKIAVMRLPATLFSGIRFVAAGSILALLARFWRGAKWPANLSEWRHVLVVAFFMVFVSNGLNAWAIHYLPSSVAALLNSTAAFWIAGLGVFGRRGHPLTGRASLGLVIGFAGTVLILMPKSQSEGYSLYAQIGALLGCLGWSLGTLYYRGLDTKISSMMFTGLQMLLGGIMLLGVAVVRNDFAHWSPDESSMVALFYLTFFSSCLAYTAYGWLTVNTTPSIIGTYSYVNPAIAAFVGWQFLHEQLSSLQFLGMFIIIVGVILSTLPGSSFADPKALEEPRSQ